MFLVCLTRTLLPRSWKSKSFELRCCDCQLMRPLAAVSLHWLIISFSLVRQKHMRDRESLFVSICDLVPYNFPKYRKWALTKRESCQESLCLCLGLCLMAYLESCVGLRLSKGYLGTDLYALSLGNASTAALRCGGGANKELIDVRALPAEVALKFACPLPSSGSSFLELHRFDRAQDSGRIPSANRRNRFKDLEESTSTPISHFRFLYRDRSWDMEFTEVLLLLMLCCYWLLTLRINQIKKLLQSVRSWTNILCW